MLAVASRPFSFALPHLQDKPRQLMVMAGIFGAVQTDASATPATQVAAR